MRNDRIYDLVCETVRKHRTRDPFELARGLDIDVDFAGLGNLKGFYILYKEHPYVVLNLKLDEKMTKLVLAHEIGHDLMHRDLVGMGGLKETTLFDMASKPEKQANIFAADLLIQDRDILSLGEEGYTVDEIAAQLGVYLPAVLIKLKDMQDRGIGVNVPSVPHGGFLADL